MKNWLARLAVSVSFGIKRPSLKKKKVEKCSRKILETSLHIHTHAGIHAPTLLQTHTCTPYRPTHKMKRNKWLEGRKTDSPIEAYIVQNPGFTL